MDLPLIIELIACTLAFAYVIKEEFKLKKR